jgi:hypothetical protein
VASINWDLDGRWGCKVGCGYAGLWTADRPQPDGLSRLSSALWFADTFHAAGMQRMKEYNEAADELAAAAGAEREVGQ